MLWQGWWNGVIVADIEDGSCVTVFTFFKYQVLLIFLYHSTPLSHLWSFWIWIWIYVFTRVWLECIGSAPLNWGRVARSHLPVKILVRGRQKVIFQTFKLIVALIIWFGRRLYSLPFASPGLSVSLLRQKFSSLINPLIDVVLQRRLLFRCWFIEIQMALLITCFNSINSINSAEVPRCFLCQLSHASSIEFFKSLIHHTLLTLIHVNSHWCQLVFLDRWFLVLNDGFRRSLDVNLIGAFDERADVGHTWIFCIFGVAVEGEACASIFRHLLR